MSEFGRRYPDNFMNFSGLYFEIEPEHDIAEEEEIETPVKSKKLSKKELLKLHYEKLDKEIVKTKSIIDKRQKSKVSADSVPGRFGPNGPYNGS